MSGTGGRTSPTSCRTEESKRFAAEGRLLARLNHPNLVRVIDLAIDEASGLLYYVMDLVLYKDGYAHTLANLEPGGAEAFRREGGGGTGGAREVFSQDRH